jgi:hypothetical protein
MASREMPPLPEGSFSGTDRGMKPICISVFIAEIMDELILELISCTPIMHSWI